MSVQTPLQRYQAALATGEFSEDAIQLAAVTYMDNLHHEILAAEGGQSWDGLPAYLKPSHRCRRDCICGAVSVAARLG